MGTDAIRRLLFNRTSGALLILGFSSGLPFVTLTRSFGFWLTDAGSSTTQIGLLSIAAIPYSAKFLWSPLIDNRRPWLPLPLGRRRAWILWMQVLLAIVFAISAIVGPWQTTAGAADASVVPGTGVSATAVAALVAIGVIIGLLSATQDISVDAYRADVSNDASRAAAASMSVSGYRLAFAGAGAGAILLASFLNDKAGGFGWPVAIGATSLLMLLCAGGAFLAPDPPNDVAPRRSFAEAVIEPLLALLGRLRGRAILIALFVILFKLPDVLPAAMLPPFLIRHLGYPTADVAIMTQAVGLGLTIVGALIGALIVPRLGLARSLLLLGILQAASTGAFALLGALHVPPDQGAGVAHWIAPGTLALLAAIVVENLCAGLVTAGFVAYLMWLCDHRWAATHYAILTSLMAVGTATAGVVGGVAIDWLMLAMGPELAWPAFFLFSVAAGVPALVLIPFVTGKRFAGRA